MTIRRATERVSPMPVVGSARGSGAVEQARRTFCGNLVDGSLVAVRDGDRLLAAAGLISPPVYDPGDELYLVWIGALEGHDEAAMTVLAASVRFALSAGKALRFEVDESNLPVWRALERLGVLADPALGFFAEGAGLERA